MPLAPADTWDLSGLYPEGVGGAAWAADLARAREAGDRLRRQIPPVSEPDAWPPYLGVLGAWDVESRGLADLAFCHWAADTVDPRHTAAFEAGRGLRSLGARIMDGVRGRLAQASSDEVEALLAHPALAPWCPWLRHARTRGGHQLPPALQDLANQMDGPALRGWEALYLSVLNPLEAVVEVPGQAPQTRPIAAVRPLLAAPEERVRRAAHGAREVAWSRVAPVAAAALSNMIAARQIRLDRLGLDPVRPSLVANRLEPGVLDAMWSAVDEVLPAIAGWLQRRAVLLGKDRVDWWDLRAPLPGSGWSVDWSTAEGLVCGAMARFSPDLEAFAARALADRWVDWGTRPGKRGGAFCASFDAARVSRVLMSFGGTLADVRTLAHELGHAYHGFVLSGEHPARRQLDGAFAETASTFAESLLVEHLPSAAPSGEIGLLDQAIFSGALFLTDVRAFYEFERDLYVLRRAGPLAPDALSAALERHQDRAFGGVLAARSPLAWVGLRHLYMSERSFYNWPYAFGYLFSSAVHARGHVEGAGFQDTFIQLLKMTGYATGAELARAALGADLSDVGFWRGALEPLERRIARFVAITA